MVIHAQSVCMSGCLECGGAVRNVLRYNVPIEPECLRVCACACACVCVVPTARNGCGDKITQRVRNDKGSPQRDGDGGGGSRDTIVCV